MDSLSRWAAGATESVASLLDSEPKIAPGGHVPAGAQGKRGIVKQPDTDAARAANAKAQRANIIGSAPENVEPVIASARAALLRAQLPDGHWCYEFEADCTIPAEYVMMMHFMDEVDTALEAKLANYLRARQQRDGGWPLYPGGAMDLSCSVKAYYALKLCGDPIDQVHMHRAREAILARGGAARANVFTRIALALFGQVPWRAIPFMPVEIILLPRWFPFHISKVAYWSRTVMVPLFILCTLKPRAANPRGVEIRELFNNDPDLEREYFPTRSLLNRTFLLLDRAGRFLEHFVPGRIRRRALATAEEFIVERLNGEDGLGGIFPAMVNAHEALALLGYAPNHPYRVATAAALQKLLVVKESEAYCQPCLSPVWDTGLSCLTLQTDEAWRSERSVHDAVLKALDWLAVRQLDGESGDWRWKRPGAPGGGWAFEYSNPHYPDVDDTPVIAWAMLNADEERYADCIERAALWICQMQSSNGGFASFDVDNTCYYLNEIPFADHGALLDPPTADVTARCVSFLSLFDRQRFAITIDRAIAFLKEQQEPDGSWFGRWGTNYIYGTWSVLVALNAAGESSKQPYLRAAVTWLESIQRADGGWGEDNFSYFDKSSAGCAAKSTSFQTAWAILALLAAGERNTAALKHGVRHLMRTQAADGCWHETAYTAPGFPRVFYLKYHGYSTYFPLWALEQFRRHH